MEQKAYKIFIIEDSDKGNHSIFRLDTHVP